ncbi:hypothetical protein ACLOJK_000961 [Asimina triloba]
MDDGGDSSIKRNLEALSINGRKRHANDLDRRKLGSARCSGNAFTPSTHVDHGEFSKILSGLGTNTDKLGREKAEKWAVSGRVHV